MSHKTQVYFFKFVNWMTYFWEIKTILLFSSCLLGITLTAQNDELALSRLPDSLLDIRPYLQIFSDDSRTMTWQEVYAQKGTSQFIPIDEFKYEQTSARNQNDFWFYFKVKADSIPKKKIVIRGFGEGELFLYQLTQRKLFDQLKVGEYYPPNENLSHLALRKNDFLVSLQNGENEFLIKRLSKLTFYPAVVQPSILKESLLMTHKDKSLLLFYIGNGVFLGIILFIFTFSLIQFFQNRNLIFITYALYVFCLCFYFSTYFSIKSQYFQIFPTWIFPINQPSNFAVVITFFHYLFLYTTLGGAENKSPSVKIFKIIAYISLFYIFLFVVAKNINANWSAPLEFFFRYLVILFYPITIYALIQHKDKVARCLLFGASFLGIFAIIGFLITRNGISHWNWWHKTMTLVQIGILLELFFYSLGIGYKTRQIEIEKNLFKNNLQLKELEAKQLKELDQLKDRFYTNITHELRTPLTVINGLTNQISNRPNYKLTERLGLIKNSTKNLIELINQLLDLSKFEAGHIDLNYQQQDIIPYLKFLTESFQSVAFDKKIMLSFYAKDTELWMDFDSEKIKRIIVNLLANSLKFTPEYGKIMVVADTMKPELVPTFINKEAKSNLLIINNLKEEEIIYLAISIKDTGKGIAPENLPYIFDRFYQTTAESQLQKGTGLGLALVKELVILMSGAIQVKSAEQEGSTITLLLPIYQKTEKKPYDLSRNKLAPKLETPKHPLPSQLPIKDSSQPKILIVEDSKDVIYYLKACLEEKYELITAINGQEGLEKAQKELPNLIISDVMMPKMDGFEMCQLLKKAHQTAHIPVILLTARTQKSDIHKGLTFGADAYLTKPFDEVELLLRVDNLLSIREKVKAQILTVQPAKMLEEADTQFLEKLQNTILENLANEDFNTTHLCRAMATSRSQLHRKLKNLTDFSTADYIRHIRLQKAKVLLTTTELSIREISMQVGFKTQAHFSRTYSNAFNETPSETRK